MEKWVSLLLNWFEINQREMPWRSDPQPYKIWISEIMLQQTQVVTVIPYFNRFIEKFPTIEDLAKADQQDVLKAWEGLGYYSRARNAIKAAQYVCESLNRNIPNTYEDLQQMPGVGPYIAAAIGSIAFGVPVPVVDGNVLRVFTRFWGIGDDIRLPKVRNRLFDRLSPFIQDVNPSSFNQGIMELGALVCTPQNPKCHDCPIQSVCYAFRNDKVSILPNKSKKAPTPHYNIAVGVIWDKAHKKVLITKRSEDKMLGGLWEFPGGKMKNDETVPEAVKREVFEETGLKVSADKCSFAVIKHAYTHFKITLHANYCELESNDVSGLISLEHRWVELSELDKYPFPTANKKLFEQLS